MTEKDITDFLEKNPIMAGAVLPFVATFSMMLILGGGMWLIQTYLDGVGV